MKTYVNFIWSGFLIPISTQNCNQIVRGCVRCSPYFTWCKWYYRLIFITFLVFFHKGGKIIFLLLSWFLSWDPVMRDRLTREKTNRYLLTCITHVYLRDTEEKWVTQRGSLEFRLKHHFNRKWERRFRSQRGISDF